MLHVPGSYRLWPGVPTCSATRALCNSSSDRQIEQDGPTTPMTQRLPAWHAIGLGYAPFRSPLLGGSRLFSLPPGTEMFQFPGFPVPALCIQAGLTGHDPSRVSPFGDPWIVGWLTPPQGLSQSPTSFIGSWCQGIHRVLFFTCRKDCSRSLWSSQGSPSHRRAAYRDVPVVPLEFGCATEGDDAPSELHKVPSVKRVLRPGRIPVPSRTTVGLPGWQVQRTPTPTSQWFTGSRVTDADVRCAS
jgi:hypothetical protein